MPYSLLSIINTTKKKSTLDVSVKIKLLSFTLI